MAGGKRGEKGGAGKKETERGEERMGNQIKKRKGTGRTKGQ